MAKAYGNGETTTNANSHINVAGTTYQNVGGDYILDGAVEKGDHMTGHIGGAIKATSRQDTATYDGKQTNAGFNVDVDLVKHGAGSSLSVNGGRTKVNADYAAVTEQTGLQYQSSDVVVEGKSTFKGAYFTTATPEANKTVFKGGLEVSDIQNHSQYKADGVSVGVSAGLTPQGNYKSGGISGIGYGKDGDSQTSTTYGAVTGVAGKSDVTTATVGDLNKPLENNFDKDRVNAEIGAQVQVSQAFDTERRSYRMEMAKKEQDLRDKADQIEDKESKEYKNLIAQADKQQHDMVLFDSITGAIYGPNSNGATGYVARAIAPEVSYQIGQYFKGNDYLNGLDNGSRNGEGSAPHILAHGILAAAVSYATGSDPTTGALSAMGAEAAAKPLAQYLFGTSDTSKLTAEQKATVSSITSLAGLGIGASTGNVGSAVNAGETARTAVENNTLSVGFSIFGHTLAKDEISEYKKGYAQNCRDVKSDKCELFIAKWFTVSSNNLGFAAHDLSEFQRTVAVKYSGAYQRCGNDTNCQNVISYLKNYTLVVFAGDGEGANRFSEGAITQYFDGKWGTLASAGGYLGAALQGVASFGEMTKKPVIVGINGKSITESSKNTKTISNDNSKSTNLKSPNSRHYADKVNQKSVAKDENTVIDRKVVNIEQDVNAIRNGQAQVINGQYHINGRIYGQHDGTLYPIRGNGFYPLDRGAYKALGVYNKFGNTPQAKQIMDNMQINSNSRQEALKVWEKVHD